MNWIRRLGAGVGTVLSGFGLCSGAAGAAPPSDPSLFACRKLSPENEVPPPPPIWKLNGDPAAPPTVASIAKLEQPSGPACAEGEIAYPKPLHGPPPVFPPPSGGNPNYYYAGNGWAAKSYGGEVEMGIAAPAVGPAPDHSLGQIAYSSGPAALRTVELGWNVDPGLYGNANPHLFSYVNKDSYASNGQSGGDCYNCDFTPVKEAPYKPGQSLATSGSPVEFGVLFKEGNWWLNVNYSWIGYLSGSFWNGEFIHPSEHADYGEVYDPAGISDMGNGLFGTNAGAVFMGRSCYFSTQVGCVQEGLPAGGPSDVFTPGLYNIGNISGDRVGWRFGGPGAG